MTFDFERFFRGLGVEVRTSGKNVKKGWLNVCCPFCGDDHGFHCGCNPASGGFACWRDAGHRGKTPTRLIQALKGCSWEEAKRIAGDDEDPMPGGESLEQLERDLLKMDRVEDRGKRLLRLPEEFQPINDRGIVRPFWDYLHRRHFGHNDISGLCQRYLLRAATSGDWRGRLILPFIDQKGIVGWQGRAISKHAKLRYLTYPDSSAAKRLLFNFGPAMSGGRVLAIVEGPFDALKIDFYGRRYGVRAVATLGTSFIEAQIGLLYKLLPRYDRALILFDPGAESPAFELESRLSSFRPVIGAVPPNREDAGDLRPYEVVPAIWACFGLNA